MSAKSRCLPDFESRSVALFARLTRIARTAEPRERVRHPQPSVEPGVRQGAIAAEVDQPAAPAVKLAAAR